MVCYSKDIKSLYPSGIAKKHVQNVDGARLGGGGGG
jgi:hypothetical protein